MPIDQNIRVTVDALIMARRNERDYILLIERGSDPFKGIYAFPGGFVEDDEDLETAARRELLEETGIIADDLTQYKAVGTPGRDPRGRTVTVIFFGCIDESQMDNAEGADDAAKAKWYPIDELPPLAFDHKQILIDFLKFIRKK